MLRKPILLALLFVGLVGCDHGTKHLAATELKDAPPRMLVENVLDLRYTENRDVGFSLLRWIPEDSRFPVVITLVSLGLLGLAWFGWRTRRESPLLSAGIVCFLAGGVGNLSDRVIRGYVVDFVHVHGWPVFNVADVAIGLGAGLVALWFWRDRRRRRAA